MLQMATSSVMMQQVNWKMSSDIISREIPIRVLWNPAVWE